MGIAPLRRPAVFLDRDGILTRAVVRDGRPYPPATRESMQLADGAVEATALLKAAGFLLLVVSNQPDVARGAQSQAEVERINEALAERLPLDGFFTCYHDDADRCLCRKPRPGLLLAAARVHAVDLAASYAIGDRWRDVDAAARAGVRPVLVDYGYSEREPDAQPGHVAAGVLGAAHWIAAQRAGDDARTLRSA
jgi:D-glycero-D-manno-heptose 1,7-bisphosphate phosphatase